MVRSVDELDAGDVEVGQVWHYAVTHTTLQASYRVGEVMDDHVRLTHLDDGGELVVSFGALLSGWVLVKEGPTRA